MTIRTVEDLIDLLAKELSWRKKELAAIKALIETRSFEHSKHHVLTRSGVTMLYAHWEGFIKVAASSYLEFVAKRRLKYEELSPNFIALAMKSKLDEASETNKATLFTEVAEFFITQLQERSNIPYKDVIKTQSNLSSSIFQEILCVIGLNYSDYESKRVIIDEKLLAKRNAIAHGEYSIIDREQYVELHSQVIDMMDLFRNQIENHASTKKYRRC